MTTTPWSEGRLLSLQTRRPRVLFGRMYEDPAVELAAFPPPGARVLCIASAGDTAATLAAAGYDVTAIDVNPAQLDYARARLTAAAPATTGSAEHLLAAGRTVAAVLPAWRPAALERFLRLDDPAAQAHHWHRHLDGPGLRLLLATTLRPAGTLAAAVRPAFLDVLPRRFDTALRARLAAASPATPTPTTPSPGACSSAANSPAHPPRRARRPQRPSDCSPVTSSSTSNAPRPATTTPSPSPTSWTAPAPPSRTACAPP